MDSGASVSFTASQLVKSIFVAVVLVIGAGLAGTSARAEPRWETEARGGLVIDGERAVARQQRRAAREARREPSARREVRRHRHHEVRRAKVIRVVKIERPEHEHGERCRPQLAVVGDQYASEQGAQQEADKAWMQTARWQWGERYMSRDNAHNASYECSRSSVGSLAGQIFFRCRLTASPCRAELTPAK